MDTITHILLGYAISQSELIPGAKSAQACIILASIAPDIDLIFRARGVEKYFIHHRKESHSFSGLFLLSLAIFGFGKYLNPGLGTARLYFLVWLGLLGHILLDFFTSYGVPIFFPLKKRFYNFALLFISDPWLDIIFLFALAGKRFFTTAYLPARLSLLAGGGYLVFLAGAKSLAKFQGKRNLERQNILNEQINAYPYFANPFRWLVLGKTRNRIYRLSVSLFGKASPTSSFSSQVPEQIKEKVKTHPLVKAMVNFSDFLWWRYFPREEEKVLQIYDLRYSQYGLGFCAQLVCNQKGELVQSQFRYY